jgi:succinate-acetate transporter protein
MKFASPAPLGLIGSALTTLMLSMVNAGWFTSACVPLVRSLWITFFLLAAADLAAMASLHVAGGYTGLVTAVLTFYLGAAEIINKAHGRALFPIGMPSRRTRSARHQPA